MANDLDGRASEYATIKSHLWLGDTHAHGPNEGVVLKDHRSDSLRYGLGQCDRRSFHDRTNLPVHLAVIDSLRQVVAQTSSLQLAVQINVDDKLLS